MRILFIGGTGNISTDCAALLHQRGHAISVVTRGQTPVPAAYRTIVADRKNLASMQNALTDEKADVVIDFSGYELPDVEIDYALFAGRISQYIFISSATVYTQPHRQLPITESTPLGNPFWEYAAKKLALEQWLKERPDFPITIVRPSHTYSPRWFPNVVSSGGYTFPARLQQGKPVWLPNDGNNLWTLTHTTDFAVALAGLVGNDRALGEAVHITSDEALPWTAIYAETAAALGVQPPVIEKIPLDFICDRFPHLTGNLKGDKAGSAVFDNSKIKRLVPDFICRTNFAAGIRQSVAWYNAHPDQKTINPKFDAIFDQVIEAWRTRPPL